jgi:hypothetical protein
MTLDDPAMHEHNGVPTAPTLARMTRDPALRPPPPEPRPPWAITFRPGKVFVGCILAGAIFMGLVFAWVLLLVPDEVLTEADPPTTAGRLAMALGGMGGVFFVVVGPTVAFLLGWLLRRSTIHSVHVLAFATTGALLGALVGAVFGPDMASALGATMGVSAGLSRAIMSRFEDVWPHVAQE